MQVTSSESTEPEYNKQYEIGVKSDWFNQRLNTQLTLYQIKKIIFVISRIQPTNRMSGQL